MKKFILLSIITISLSASCFAQSIGIGTKTPNGSSMLEIKSSNKGLLIPRTSTASRNVIVNPAKGLMVYDTTTNSFWFHNNVDWVEIGDGNNSWSLTGNAGIDPATQFIGTTDAAPLSFRTNNFLAGSLTMYNTAIGVDALFSNQSGKYNTAIGVEALGSDLSDNNTAIGDGALLSNTVGSYNIAVGVLAGSCIGFNNLNNSIVIGSNTCTQNSNYALFGTSSTVWNGGNVGWSTYSDGRIKRNIKENVAGLSFIMKLRPITYNRNLSDVSRITGEVNKEYPGKNDIEKIRLSGFVAQDVEKAALEIGYDFGGITKPKTSTDLYSLSYESFVVPLVKAVQEQQQIIETQRNDIDILKAQLAKLTETVNTLMTK